MSFTPTNPIDTPDFSQQPAIGGFVFAQAQNITIAAGQNNFGPWYVGNVQSTISKIFCGANLGDWINLTWWADQQMSSSINSIQYKKAHQSWTVDNNPNYGPWLSMQIESNTGVGQSGVYYQLSGAPLWNPSGTVGQWVGLSPGILCVQPFGSLAAGGQLTITPNYFVPGAAQLYVQASPGPAAFAIKCNTGTFSGQDIAGIGASGTALILETTQVSLPYDDWQLQIFNTGAVAANVEAVISTLR